MSFELPVKLMREGLGSISYGSPPPTPTPGIFTGANNGLSRSTINPNLVVWGQDTGQPGDPAKLLSNREIPFNDFSMVFKGLAQSAGLAPAPFNKVWFQSVFNGGGVFNGSAAVFGDDDQSSWQRFSGQVWMNPSILVSKKIGNDFDNIVGLEMSASTPNLNGWLFNQFSGAAGEYNPNLRVASSGRAGASRAFQMDMVGRIGGPHFSLTWNDYDTYAATGGLAMLPGADFMRWTNGQSVTDPNAFQFLYIFSNYHFILGKSTPPSIAPPDNGAVLQIQGDVTTADPGTGVGRWLLGQFHAGAVVPDAANYVEVNIDGVVRKLIVAV